MRTVLACAMSAILLLAACQRSTVTPSTLPVNVQDIVNAVNADSSPGTAKTGRAPSPAGGPTITVAGNGSFINGGTLPVTISSASTFDTIYMVISARTVGLDSGGPGGIDGYYELRLPSKQSSATAVLAFAQSIAIAEFDLQFAVAESSGPVGPFASFTATAIPVGTGDVQVSLSWDVDSDVDLHVVDPRGEEVYYGNPRSASGGQLDLDSNAACSIDHKRNENITWAVGLAPRGRYTVRLDYWDSCSVSRSNYSVRIISEGTSQIFNGSFTGPGDQGGLGSGRFIANLDRQTGPTAQGLTPTTGLNLVKGLFKK